MPLLTWFLAFFALLLLLAWRPASLRTTGIAFGLGLLAFSLFGPEAFLLKLLLWLILLGLGTALWLPTVRQDYVLRPLMQWARRSLPDLSATEREAIEAGSVGWEAELFAGRPNWHRLRAVPTPGLSPEEQSFLEGPVQTFCDMLDEWDISHELADLPVPAWDFLREQGFFGLEIPTRYGGKGFSAGAHAAILRRIGSTPAGMVAGSIVAVPNSLGPAALLLKYGSEDQKDHFLPRLASGEDIPCFALTSPVAGSDAGAIQDEGIVCEDSWQGRQVIGMRLNLDKRYITLAPVATVIGLAFRLRDPDGLLGDQIDLGLCCALIGSDTPGLDIGQRHLPLNAPFMNGPIRGRDVFVPLDCLIGGLAMAGQGWRMLTECLATGRGISLPAGSSGMLQGLARNSGAYARLREQFGRPIGDFEGISEVLGGLAGRSYAARALSRYVAGAVDLGERPALAASIAKLQCTELMRQGVTQAMDIHAGKGVMLGPNNWLGRHWQSAPVHITVEGANILTRSMMIYGQGAMRAHPYVLREIEALQADDAERFETLLAQHLGMLCSVASRAFLLGLSGALFGPAPAGGLNRHYRRLARYSAAFALLSECCLISLGPQLKLREALSGRLADALSWLYLASVSLKQFEEDGEISAHRPALDWVCAEAAVRIEKALDGVLLELPSRPLAWLARALIFPLGRHARPLGDEALHKAARLLQTPGAARDALTPDAWVSNDRRHPTGRLERCLAARDRMKNLERRLRRAISDGQLPEGLDPVQAARDASILDAAEAEALQTWQQLLREVMAVDAFSSKDLAHRPPAPVRRRKRPAGG